MQGTNIASVSLHFFFCYQGKDEFLLTCLLVGLGVLKPYTMKNLWKRFDVKDTINKGSLIIHKILFPSSFGKQCINTRILHSFSPLSCPTQHSHSDSFQGDKRIFYHSCLFLSCNRNRASAVAYRLHINYIAFNGKKHTHCKNSMKT